MQDKHFDGHESRFEKNIYETNKGKLRLALLKTQLRRVLPCIEMSSNEYNGSLSLLDVGGGLGHMSQWSLEQGHQVTYIEPAEKLFNTFCDKSRAELESGQLQALNMSFQEFNSGAQTSAKVSGELVSKTRYDLIICHAVLEWTTEHQPFIQQLLSRLKPDGYLSLAFYNQHSIHIANAIKGNLRKLASGNIAGDGSGLTPINPPKTQDVDDILQAMQVADVHKFGIRVLHDYMWKKSRDKISFEDLLTMELQYMAETPYRDMGRYCHWIIQK
jgi:S-adenosylmethionine-dependent methyltransferase